MNRTAFALAGLVKAGAADEATIKGLFIDAVLALPCAGPRWTRQDADLKWRRALRDAPPRQLPASQMHDGAIFVHPIDAATQAANERVAAEYKAEKVADEARKRKKAQDIWAQRESPFGALPETYLERRGIPAETIPPTIGFVSDARAHFDLGFQGETEPVPCMIAAFGVPFMCETGAISMPAGCVQGLHITRLFPDGRGRAVQKKTFGPTVSFPVVLSPPGDSLALLMSEGIEDAMSAWGHGFELWAAGTANRLPKLAAAVPDVIESVSIVVDDDQAGRTECEKAKRLIRERGIEARLCRPWRLT